MSHKLDARYDIVRKAFTFASASPTEIMQSTEGLVVVRAWVRVTTIWDGSGMTLDVGDVDDVDGFIINPKINLSVVGWYGVIPDDCGAYLYDSNKAKTFLYPTNTAKSLKMTFAHGSSTQGAGEVFLEVRRLLDI